MYTLSGYLLCGRIQVVSCFNVLNQLISRYYGFITLLAQSAHFLVHTCLLKAKHCVGQLACLTPPFLGESLQPQLLRFFLQPRL